MPPTMTAEPPCLPAAGDPASFPAETRPLRAVRRPFDAIDRETWDALAAANPWATPFSAWPVHRAWWDAYGGNAHEETLAIVPVDATDDAAPVAIAPLMHRHEVEPRDLELHTTIRHTEGESLTPVPPNATAIFFGASYHADYATLLGTPDDLPAVADAVADYCVATSEPSEKARWDVVDLRRLRCEDPATDALAEAFGRRAEAHGWTMALEQEDVCPVVALSPDGTLDDVLGALGKKERHEIRRKVRRAEAAGELRLDVSPDPLADLPAFIDLHQKRWGADGLFPDTPGGAQSRIFLRRLFELQGTDGPVRLSFLTVGGRRIAAGLTFETDDTLMYYNAGIDPAARELSPGVVMTERYLRRALDQGMTRLDFLRGNEPYKYEWGATDERIGRILVRRGPDQMGGAAR